MVINFTVKVVPRGADVEMTTTRLHRFHPRAVVEILHRLVDYLLTIVPAVLLLPTLSL